jgi:hypothetical protein
MDRQHRDLLLIFPNPIDRGAEHCQRDRELLRRGAVS